MTAALSTLAPAPPPLATSHKLRHLDLFPCRLRDGIPKSLLARPRRATHESPPPQEPCETQPATRSPSHSSRRSSPADAPMVATSHLGPKLRDDLPKILKRDLEAGGFPGARSAPREGSQEVRVGQLRSLASVPPCMSRSSRGTSGCTERKNSL